MDFPILSLIDDESAEEWLLNHFHPQGLHCPHCDASVEEARYFRTTKTSRLKVYRCPICKGVYNLYSGTVFAQKQYRPSQVVLLLQGVCKGFSSAQLARELDISRQAVLSIRRVLQASAQMMQPEVVLPDTETETDEMFQNAGEKGDPHKDPKAPPRRRGNKRRGHGTYENDRPPIVCTIGRKSKRVRLRVAHRTDSATLSSHVHQFTLPIATVHTDGWRGYNGIDRSPVSVCDGDGEWARDDDADGIFETHINTIEGVWTTVRNFLRPFRGVHKKFLSGYIAICEFVINLKSITTEFISKLVQRTHS